MRLCSRFPARRALSVLAAACALLTGTPARADVPRVIGYQGRLLNADGTATTGVVTVTYAVFDAAENGQKLWSEEQHLALSDGYYASFLGQNTAFPDALFDGSDRWLQVTVDGEDLQPRQRIGSVAFSLRAQTAQNVAGGTVDATRIAIGGRTVIDEQGRLSGAAAYVAGPGLELDEATRTISLAGSCATGEVLRWSGSTWQCASAGSPISVAANSGLLLEGNNLALRAGCQAGELLKFDGTAWACAADVDTNYAAGNGLELHDGAFRLSTACAAGELLKWNGAAWACAADVDTNYTAKDGLVLSGTAFGLRTDCAAGEFLAFDGSGWSCTPETTWMAGSGLERSGTRFSLLTTCAAGEMLKWNGTAWACAPDLDTTYTAKNGVVLTGNAIGLRTDCAPGEFLAFDGTGWACTPETTYRAGSGLERSGTTFRLDTSCAAGELLKWNGTAWACAGDVDTTYTASNGLVLAGRDFRLAPFPAPTSAGTAPQWDASTTPPTLQLPLASSTGTTAGLLTHADYVAFGAKQAALTFAGPLASSSNTVSIAKAGAGVDGYLSGADWSTFDAKQAALTFAGPLANASNTVSIAQSGPSADGYLSSTDWNTFNAKQAALTFAGPLANSSGNVSLAKAGASADGYLSSADWNTFNAKQAALTFAGPLTNTSGTIALAQAGASSDGYLSSADWASFSARFGPNSVLGAGQVWVGSSAGKPAAVTLGGDATLSSSGTLTLANSGVSAGSYAKVAVDAKGRVTGGAGLAASDVPGLDAAKITSGTLAVANGGTGSATASALTVFAGPTSGSGAPSFRALTAGDLPAGTATQWTTSGSNVTYSGGSVGIGTPTPGATLDVNGAIRTAAVSNASTSINFAGGNLQSTTASCGAMTLNNMASGATYSLAVQGAAGGTCSFSAFSGNGTGALTVRSGSINLAQTAGKHAVFSFMVLGSVVYVASVDGY